MANLNVNPEYDIDMEQLTPETRAHADRFNERYGQLLGNDAFLKGKLEEANTSIERAMAVAQGKSAGLVFNTYAELLAYIAVPANAEKFRLGDQFLIKATDVPDYWWDNTVTTAQTDSAGNVISGKNTSGKVIGALVELEARKIDLSKYDVNDAALFNNMSDQYNSSRTYDVGDICIYNNNLYKCITAVKAAETFNASKWNKTSLAALHAEQEKKISENNQPPTYTEASSLSALTSGEKLSVAFGKIAKAVSTLISHISTKATSSVLGHVKLSDSTSSTSAASTGVAATPKAVKAAYDLANSHTKKLGTTDISSIGDGTVTGAIAVNKEAIEEVNQSLTNLNPSRRPPAQRSWALTSSSRITTCRATRCQMPSPLSTPSAPTTKARSRTCAARAWRSSSVPRSRAATPPSCWKCTASWRRWARWPTSCRWWGRTARLSARVCPFCRTRCAPACTRFWRAPAAAASPSRRTRSATVWPRA